MAAVTKVEYTRLERLLENMYKEGKITFMEYSAILGCCETVWDGFDKDKFTLHFGTKSIEALTKLMSKEKAE